MSPIVRDILSQDINLSADEVIKKARAKGVTAPDSSVRDTIYNVRSELKKKAAKPGAKTTAPKSAPAPTAARKTAPAPKAVRIPLSPNPDVAATLANVALVNTVVGACGGVEPARQAAEAVRACGSVDAFLQHLDLVAKVRGQAPGG
jgi:hypothetical protein